VAKSSKPFNRWQELFFISVDKYYMHDEAKKFKLHSEGIANDFIKVLKLK